MNILALARLISEAEEKRNRKEILPGTYTVSGSIDYELTLNVGEDYSSQIVAKADPWLLLAIALSKLNGITVEALVREALEHQLDTDVIKETANRALAAIKLPTLTTCKGKITVENRNLEILNAVIEKHEEG